MNLNPGPTKQAQKLIFSRKSQKIPFSKKNPNKTIELFHNLHHVLPWPSLFTIY